MLYDWYRVGADAKSLITDYDGGCGWTDKLVENTDDGCGGASNFLEISGGGGGGSGDGHTHLVETSAGRHLLFRPPPETLKVKDAAAMRRWKLVADDVRAAKEGEKVVEAKRKEGAKESEEREKREEEAEEAVELKRGVATRTRPMTSEGRVTSGRIGRRRFTHEEGDDDDYDDNGSAETTTTTTIPTTTNTTGTTTRTKKLPYDSDHFRRFEYFAPAVVVVAPAHVTHRRTSTGPSVSDEGGCVEVVGGRNRAQSARTTRYARAEHVANSHVHCK